MNGKANDPLVLVFFATWIALALASLAFRYLAPISLRQKLRIPFAVGTGALFLIFVGFISGLEIAPSLCCR